MTAFLILAVGLAMVVGLVVLMARLEQSQRRLIRRRRAEWEAGGGVGAPPDDFIGRGGNTGTGI